jgi:hypothetical protein
MTGRRGRRQIATSLNGVLASLAVEERRDMCDLYGTMPGRSVPPARQGLLTASYCHYVPWGGMAQLVARRLDGKEALVRFSAPQGVLSSEAMRNVSNKRPLLK